MLFYGAIYKKFIIIIIYEMVSYCLFPTLNKNKNKNFHSLYMPTAN